MGAVIEAEIKWGIKLTYNKRDDEYVGPCPWCSADDDGFHVWDDAGNYWCRQCERKGWVNDDKDRQPSEAEKLARRVAELERKQQEHERRLSQLEKMAQCKDHLAYHNALDARAMEYWFGEGIYEETIKRYLLGYCESCPTCRSSPSHTIPVINRGKLENIRHRLVEPQGGKYRPHLSGLGNPLFNVDLLDQATERIVIVEGEKKSIVLAQAGFPNVGITGKRAFKKSWIPWFANVREIVIALDPDATESAYKLAGMLGERARVAVTPVKIDDAIVRYGAGADDIRGMLRWARQVD